MSRQGFARDCPRFSAAASRGRTPGHCRRCHDQRGLHPAPGTLACAELREATDELIARDAVVRQAAFDHVHPLRSRDLELSHEDIARGFMLEGQRWPLWNPQRGIFKPRGMPFLLSSRTVFPRRGGRVWYDDQRQVHQHLRVGSVGDVVAGILQDDGPSIIDYRTLRWSAGQLPLRFLRGCGLSEWEIEATKLYRQALGRDQITDLAYEIARLRGEQPIKFYSCFISYSSQDGEFAEPR